ncbi:MAG TPA: N-acyl homoserine lactonase family protein [Victivallales bacterium]|nr:N-acyl homoserine lactonase family protein [Victivallales bacterium]
MKLHMFNSGHLGANSSHLVCDGSCDEIKIPVSYNLIEHPAGLVLFDGGNALEVVSNSIEHWGDVAKAFKVLMSEDEFVVNQLKKLNIDTSDIKYIVQSHLHLDHTGALGQFPNAKVIVQKKELQYALSPDYFQKSIYIQKDIQKEKNWFTLNGFEDDYFDLFGDGKIKLLYTPGHSPGHQSMLLNMPKTGRILLAGDVVHISRALDENIVPASSLFYNAEEYVRSVNRLRILREQGCKLFLGHDPDEFFNKPYLD